MNVGLLYTPVSIYQMTRGALVLFVGIFSVIFLRRRLWLYQFGPFPFPHGQSFPKPFPFRWVSLITVMAGVSLVGYSGSLIKDVIKENSIALNLLRRLVGIDGVSAQENPEPTSVLVGEASPL